MKRYVLKRACAYAVAAAMALASCGTATAAREGAMAGASRGSAGNFASFSQAGSFASHGQDTKLDGMASMTGSRPLTNAAVYIKAGNLAAAKAERIIPITSAKILTSKSETLTHATGGTSVAIKTHPTLAIRPINVLNHVIPIPNVTPNSPPNPTPGPGPGPGPGPVPVPDDLRSCGGCCCYSCCCCQTCQPAPCGNVACSSCVPSADSSAVPVNPLPMEAVPANPLPMVARSIAVVNPTETGVTLQFLVDGQLKSLPSGSRLELTAVQAGVLDFDRGGSFGKTRLVMADGIYTFAGTEHGWTLNQTPYTPPETDQVAAE